MSAIQTSKESKVEEQQRCCQGPVNVSSPVHLAIDILGGVGDVVVLLADADVVIRDACAGGHGEVGDGSKDRDQGRDDMVEAFGLSTA